ncbi:MAG: acyltransferase [Cytophagaceae bacterium]|nr:acyltransferase [Cytophagaceae bacterium]
MTTINSKPHVFFPNLDALRFFCFIAVFFFHSFATSYESVLRNPTYGFIKYDLFRNGNLGVNFFFVLSGFLITYLLFVEKENLGKISIRKFYMRRVLRIWPLFYFCVLFGFLIFPFLKSLLGGQASAETATPIYYILFLNNLEFAYKGLPDSSVLVILWSVAIEEQFYLVWPWIIQYIKIKQLPYIFIAIIICSFGFRLINAKNEIILEVHTLSCISDLSMGGLGAYLIFYSEKFKHQIESLSTWFIVFIYAACFLVFFFRADIFSYNVFLIAFERLIISILFLLIILEQNFSRNSIFKLHVLKIISKLGQYTYGLYCLHMICILIIATVLSKLGWNKSTWQVLVLEGGISLALTIGAALISYHFYEKKFLKIKDFFAVVKK